MIIWDSEKKDYVGIISLRDLLEILVFLCDSLQMAFTQDEHGASLKEKEFINYFMEKYFCLQSPVLKQTTDTLNLQGLS